MQRNVFETFFHWVNEIIEYRIKKAPYDKSYGGIISDILFEPDTPMNSSEFGTYKVKYGTTEKTFKLNDNFVHEIGERVEVCVYENNPNHIVVKPVIKRIPPYKIDYDDNEKKYLEYRRTTTKGKVYETISEIKLTLEEKDDDNREVKEMNLADGHTIHFEGWGI